MTTYVNPSNSFTTQSREIGRVFRYSGHTDSFIADGTTLVSDIDTVGVTTGPLNAFAKASESGLDFTIDTGEAMVEGALVASDEQTTVNLDPSDSGTIYLAWDPNSSHTIIIDSSTSGNTDGLPRTPLYDYTTDTTSVTSDTSVRVLGEHIGVQNNRYETSDSSGQPVDQADNAANLGGLSASSYAVLSQDEVWSGRPTFQDGAVIDTNNQNDPALEIIGANAVDATGLSVVSDADSGQDDDGIIMYGLLDPQTTSPGTGDTVLVAKGDGRVGINRYSPVSALDVMGDANIRGEIGLHNHDINNINSLNGNDGQEVRINQGGGSDIALAMAGSGGTGMISVRDTGNNSIMDFNDGGEVDVPNGNIETQNGFCITNASRAYDVQKNGTDGAGIINFKT